MRNPQAFRQTKFDCIIKPNEVADMRDQVMSDAQSCYSSVDISGTGNRLGGAKPSAGVPEKRHFKGCNCRKSHCQKKYCECYQQGVPCSDLCNCDQCENTEAHVRAHAKLVDSIRNGDHKENVGNN